MNSLNIVSWKCRDIYPDNLIYVVLVVKLYVNYVLSDRTN